MNITIKSEAEKLRKERDDLEQRCANGMKENMRQAREIEDLKDENKLLREALEKTSAACDCLAMGCGGSIEIEFKEDHAHYGTLFVSDILDEANSALEGGE